jgi:hypothetical protein
MKNAAPLIAPLIALLAATNAATAPTVLLPRAAFAADPIAPAPLPDGAARMEDAALRRNFGRLLSDFAKEREVETRDGAPVEVVAWSGDAYRPGRADATRAALVRALKAAGYECEDVDKEEMRANPFSEEVGLAYDGEGSLGVTPWDVQRGLVAVNPKTGKTLLGMWFDQKEKKRLVLGLMPAADRAVRAAAPLPGLPAGAVLVKDPNDSMAGLPSPKAPAFPNLARVPGHARGMVKDGAGRPVAGASVVIESTAAGGLATSVTATTNAQGVYDIPVPFGVARALMGGHTVRRDGQPFTLSLQPADGASEDFPSRQGHVENFVLRTWGVADPAHVAESPHYPGHYYGGSVRVQWFGDDIPKGGVVEVTLTPQGPLLDGGAGKTLVYRLANGGRGDVSLNDIPLGRYVMTARFLEDGKADPLRVRSFAPGSSDEMLDSLPIVFKSQRGGQSFVTGGNVEQVNTLVKF